MSPAPAERTTTVENRDPRSARRKVGSLATRLVVLMLAVSLVPLGLLGGAWLSASGEQIRDESEQVMSQTAEALATQVDEWVDKNVRALQAAARLPAVAGMKADDQTAVMKAVQESYPWMYLVFTVGLDGKSVARSDGKPQADYSDRTYFRDVGQVGQEVAWQNLIGRTSGQPALVLAVPIRSNGTLVGVMAAAMTIEQISKAVATWRKGTTGHAFIVDERDKVIAHPRADYVTAQQDLKAHPLVRGLRAGGHQTRLASFDSTEGVATVGVAHATKYNWGLVIEQDDAEVFAGLRRARLITGILLVLTVVVVGLVAWRTGAATVRPIVQLTSLADRISLGEMDVTIDIQSNDEIGQLAASFGRLQTSLRRAMDRLKSPAGGSSVRSP